MKRGRGMDKRNCIYFKILQNCIYFKILLTSTKVRSRPVLCLRHVLARQLLSVFTSTMVSPKFRLYHIKDTSIGTQKILIRADFNIFLQ